MNLFIFNWFLTAKDKIWSGPWILESGLYFTYFLYGGGGYFKYVLYEGGGCLGDDLVIMSWQSD